MRIPISLICLNASRMSSLCEAGFFRERNEVRAHCLHRSFLWRGPTCRCGGNLPRLIFLGSDENHMVECFIQGSFNYPFWRYQTIETHVW